jgi:GT2 family glycosyltransferase
MNESMVPLVHAIVVNWNGCRHLLECLSSLEQTDYPASRFNVTIVDNASADGSQAVVRDKFPQMTLLENRCNLGYVVAVNQGTQKALEQGANYVWIFNNDVVVYPDTLRHLLRVAGSDPKIAVTGPVIYSYEKEKCIDHSGYRINPWTGYLHKLRHGVEVFADGKETADVDSILGCSNLIRADAWHEIGPFNPVYNLYFEETDFNTRARQKGWRVVLVRNAAVRHRLGGTMNRFLGRRAWLLLRNLFIFQYRNAHWRHLLVFIPYFFLIHVPYFLMRGLYYGLSIKLKHLTE